MKDKRNCGSNISYPVYQQPMMVPPMGYPMGYPGAFQTSIPTNGVSSNTIEQQLNNIEQQINLLDQRISRLENFNNNNSNKYTDSNYYMV